jgi:hypothetical protein
MTVVLQKAKACPHGRRSAPAGPLAGHSPLRRSRPQLAKFPLGVHGGIPSTWPQKEKRRKPGQARWSTCLTALLPLRLSPGHTTPESAHAKVRPRYFVAFMPPELEKKLFEMEKAAAEGRAEDDIRETKFKVVR